MVALLGVPATKYGGDGDLPNNGHTGIIFEDLKALELPVHTDDGSQIVA